MKIVQNLVDKIITLINKHKIVQQIGIMIMYYMEY